MALGPVVKSFTRRSKVTGKKHRFRTLRGRRVSAARLRETPLGRLILQDLGKTDVPDEARVTEPPWAKYAREEGRLI